MKQYIYHIYEDLQYTFTATISKYALATKSMIQPIKFILDTRRVTVVFSAHTTIRKISVMSFGS